MKVTKFRSSKELKESLQNIDRAINPEVSEVEAHSEVDLVMADAYEQDLVASAQVAETLEELTKDAEELTLKEPEAPMTVKNTYTAPLKLDEAIEDFSIKKDGRSNKEKTRGEDEGNKFLDYTMFDFVSELLTGKNCNTNPAPITPLVWRRDPKDKDENGEGKFKYMEMKKFMTQGEDKVSYGGLNVAGVGDYEGEDDSDFDNNTEADGMFAGTGAPQIGVEDDGFTIYSNSLEDLEQAQQGLSHYGIKYGIPTPKRSLSKTIHWNYRMRVYVPMNYKGEFLTLREWLTKTGRKVEDVMRPDFVKGFNKVTSKVDKAADTELVNSIFNSYIQKSNEDSTLSVDTLLDMMFDELEGLPFNKEELEAKFRAEVSAPSYYDIFDKYIAMAEEHPERVDRFFNAFLKELKVNKIKVNEDEVRDEFYGELE